MNSESILGCEISNIDSSLPSASVIYYWAPPACSFEDTKDEINILEHFQNSVEKIELKDKIYFGAETL